MKLKKFFLASISVSLVVASSSLVVACSNTQHKNNNPNNNKPSTDSPSSGKLDVSKIPSEFVVENNTQKLNETFYETKIETTKNNIRNIIVSDRNNISKLANEFAYLFLSLGQYALAKTNEVTLSCDIYNFGLTRDEINRIVIEIESKNASTLIAFDWFKNLTINCDANQIVKSINIKTIGIKNFSTREYQIQLSKVFYEAYLTLRNGMSDLDKVLAISNYIAKYINYSVEDKYNFYDTIMTRNGVCRDYCTMASVLLSSLGIDNYVEFGYSVGANSLVGGYHVWNVVNVNNKWLVLDITSSDANYTDIRPINAAGASLYYQTGFLIGKDDNKNFASLNSAIQGEPDINDKNLIDENAPIQTKYEKVNSTFIYKDYFSNESQPLWLRSITKANIMPLGYYNGYWYTFYKNSSTYDFVKYNANTNIKTTIFSLANVFNTNEVMFYENTFFIAIIDAQNQKKYLKAISLNENVDQATSLINIKELNYHTSYSGMYVENNSIKLGDQIIIDDLNTINSFKKESSIAIEYQSLFYNLLSNIWKATTTVGSSYGQVTESNYNSFINATANDLNSFKQNIFNQIKWKQPEIIFNKNLENEIKINPQYFNTILNNFGWFKLSVLAQVKDSNLYPSLPTLEYRWYHNSNIFSSSTESGTLTFNPNIYSINELLGEWYCEVVDLSNPSNKIRSNTLNIVETSETLYSFYPYGSYLDEYTNTSNKDLELTIKNLNALPNCTTYYDVILNGNKIIDNHYLDLSVVSDTRIIYRKSFNDLVASDFGEYQIIVRYVSNTNSVSWDSGIYTYKYFKN